MSEDPVVIVAAKRTAIGTFGGGLSTVEAPRLGQVVISGSKPASRDTHNA